LFRFVRSVVGSLCEPKNMGAQKSPLFQYKIFFKISLTNKAQRPKKRRSLCAYLFVYLSVGMSARCDWLAGYYLRKSRHCPGRRLTSLGGLTKMPPKSSNNGDCSRARDPRTRGNGKGKGICITGLIYTRTTNDQPCTGISY
jgi:hypothetical protein